MRNFGQVKRVVIKIGTNTLSRQGGVDTGFVRRVARQAAGLMADGRQVVIITSGAIGMGAGAIGESGPVKGMKLRQACAAIGQPLLMQEYRRAFLSHGINVAQVLLTAEVLDHRSTYLNLRNSVETLLKLGVVPVMNENDSISTEEIGSAFGDNDKLSALVASKLDAGLLIMLSDIDGLYDKNPHKYPDAKRISAVYEITDELIKAAGSKGSVHATGGMRTKLEAARIASDAGCRMVLADGRARNVIARIMSGADVGTVFMPRRKLGNRLRWILNSKPVGTVEIDGGAVRALRNKKSLLAKGITAVRGNFGAGQVVWLNNSAKAVSHFSSAELRSLAGKHSSEIAEILGDNRRVEVALPEDIVFVDC